ncbi:MAG TPA: hypothetical protein VK727_15655 [Steroidobacteraceae bacterium]|jgi:hypothetical protein|nr:hypothetical protein [Steroidobacteraceae bacterium]
MRLVIVLTLSMSLCGCIASNAVVRSQAMSFDDIIEDTTDKLLVLNILRAKDKAPLHFDEIPSIHESVTTNASVQGVWPFGPANKSTARNTLQAGAGVQMAPSFELDNLATKDFITGMATPIDPKFVKYWLDRGLDRRVVLLLFFSAIDVTVAEAAKGGTVEHTIRIRNSPRDAIDALYTVPPASGSAKPTFAENEMDTCRGQSDFLHYLKLINNLTSFTAQSKTQPKVILESISLDNVDLARVIAAMASLDSTKTSVKYNKTDNTLSLFGKSASTTALCLSRAQARGSAAEEEESACAGPAIGTSGSADADDTNKTQDVQAFPEFVAPNDARVTDFCTSFGRMIEQLHVPDKDEKMLTTQADPKPRIRMEIRSVGEIIQFLGDLTAYQEAIQAYQHSSNNKSSRPDIMALHPILTFGFCGYLVNQGLDPHCGDYFFNISSTSGSEESRFSVRYRGQTYYVPRYSLADQWQNAELAPCSGGDAQPGKDASCIDHTLEVLAVVNQLTDLQRSAQDVQQTPYVSVLP